MTPVLFTRPRSVYLALGADCWDARRDARNWQGGRAAVYHPPCRAWGQLSHFAKPRHDERELALWAIDKVRQFGGVLEHPINSRLWDEAQCYSWGVRDDHGGVLVPVLQASFGHRALKATGLYFVGRVPELPTHFDGKAYTTVERMCRAEREATPRPLARFLLAYARSCDEVSA